MENLDGIDIISMATVSGYVVLIRIGQSQSQISGRFPTLQLLTDACVLKFGQPMSNHVRPLEERFGIEVGGYFNLEWLGLTGADGSFRLEQFVRHYFPAADLEGQFLIQFCFIR